MWEEKYNALLDNYNQMCANRDVAVTNSSNLLKRLDVANELVQDLNSQLEKANTEDWSPKVQVYKEKLEVATARIDEVEKWHWNEHIDRNLAEERVEKLEALVRDAYNVLVTPGLYLPEKWEAHVKELLEIK